MKLILILINVLLSLVAFPMVMRMFKNNNVVALNYKKEEIPICLGVVFIFIEMVTLSIYFLFYREEKILIYLLGILSVGLIGLLDDLTGDTQIKGLKGHIKAFFKGELTTGFMKASIGFFVSAIISVILSKDIANIILNTFLLALSINMMNLFDLRPGRCLKVFIFLGVVFLTISGFKASFILVSMLSISLIYFRYDIRAEAMLGDVGSNILGFTLGFSCVLTQNIYIRLLYTLILVGLHILAERLSISELIEENKFLKFIDQLGR